MHIETLELLWGENVAEEKTKPLAKAVRSGSMFWIISFLTPSVFFTCVGLEVLIWSVSTVAVGASVTVGMAYGVWQIYRALLRIKDVTAISEPSDVSQSQKGKEHDLEKGLPQKSFTNTSDKSDSSF